MLFVVCGVVIVLGAIALEAAVSMRAVGAVAEAREEAEDWRTVAENLGRIVDHQPYILDSFTDVGFDESRVARVMAQLNACREAYPR